MSVSTELKNATTDEERAAIIERRRRDRMAQVDALPADLRQCVHDYSWNVVDAFMRLGIRKSRHIRHLVETVLDEFSPTRGSSSNQGIRPGITDNKLP